MLFFDYVFFLFVRSYESYEKKNIPTTAAGMLGFFQCMNVLIVLMLISFLIGIDYFSKIIV